MNQCKETKRKLKDKWLLVCLWGVKKYSEGMAGDAHPPNICLFTNKLCHPTEIIPVPKVRTRRKRERSVERKVQPLPGDCEKSGDKMAKEAAGEGPGLSKRSENENRFFMRVKQSHVSLGIATLQDFPD